MHAPANLSNLKVLVVDDQPFLLNLLKWVLQKLDCHDVTTAISGAVALDQLRADPCSYDVIICDLSMPGMDGIEFINHMAKSAYGGAVIFLSAVEERILDAATQLAREYDLNVLGALSKPVNTELLRALLEQVGPREPKPPYARQDSISEAELIEGLQTHAYELVFQPKVDVGSGRIVGVEALTRWRHPERGLLGPGAFIPLAESIGLVDQLSDMIYREAIHHVRRWGDLGFDIQVGVNFPVNTFLRPKFFDFLLETTRNAGIEPRLVVLEVTETQVMVDVPRCVESMTRLRMRDFVLSIDDFGTGHSSMEQLKRIPFSELKIDRAFVTDAIRNPSAHAILESSVQLAKKLKLKIVAEGVETREDWDEIESLGCEYAQGFYCAKPMPNEEFVEFLSNWRGPH